MHNFVEKLVWDAFVLMGLCSYVKQLSMVLKDFVLVVVDGTGGNCEKKKVTQG